MKNELKLHEQPVSPIWEPCTETRILRCRVNSEETNILAKEQSEIIQQVARLEDAKKASASEYKARIEEKQARGSRIAGKTDREVKCEWYFECSGFDSHTGERIYHPEKKALVRLDTLELIEVKDITNEERQMALPISEEEPT